MDDDLTFQRHYTVTLRVPQSLTFDKEGLAQWLEVYSPPMRELIAKNMAEDWDCFNIEGPAEFDATVRWIAEHIVKIEEAD